MGRCSQEWASGKWPNMEEVEQTYNLSEMGKVSWRESSYRRSLGLDQTGDSFKQKHRS